MTDTAAAAERLAEAERAFAVAMKRYMDSLIEAGFTEEQAFTLTRDYHQSMCEESRVMMNETRVQMNKP